MRFTLFRLIGCVLMALCMAQGAGVHFAPDAAAQSESLQTFSTAPLDVVTRSGRHTFTVEIAETGAQRAQGLMFRSRLAPDGGMLFIYPAERRLSMWMKNTLIPLDMLFVASDGKVVGIHERAVPHSLRSIPSPLPARAVVELAGGTVSRLGIRVGDRVISKPLGTARPAEP
ncbi:MAG: DUF192 domain-containing protein [Alphaproteobacteria bacterium]